jgi:eukaryotic-like serine/threonine-protein kinase
MLEDAPQVAALGSPGKTWTRIRQTFLSAIELNTEQRGTFLTSACAGDPSLRSEVERLLIHNDRRGGPLDRGLAAPTEPDADCDPRRIAPGHLVCGRFRILRLIGEGGMGEVFEAEDIVLGEKIALKAIRPEIANQSGLVERMRREVHLSRQVSHTNVCRVFELWEYETTEETRTCLLTMELLEGETLAERIEACGPISPKEGLPLIRQIAEGLNAVHRLGIVHRDLKPSNLYLVENSNSAVRVVVTDFGLARPVNADEYSRTQTGFVLGTPAYMAPEQFQSGEATFASDIYSFGVTIFEMITGRKHPLSAPSAIVDGIPSSWDKALEKCWDPNPAERPASAIEVLKMIERPVHYVMRRFLRPALLLLLMGVLGTAAYQVSRSGFSTEYRLTNVTSDDGLSWQPSLSADGQTIAYASDVSGRGELDIFVRRLDNSAPKRITDDPRDNWEPALSSDGTRVAYLSARDPKGIYLRNVSGGPERLISRFGQQPSFSSDGMHIAFWTGRDGQFGEGRIYVTDVNDGSTRQLANAFVDARSPIWNANGKELLFEGCGPGCTDAETQRDWWRIRPDGSHLLPTGALQTVLHQGLTLYFEPPQWLNGTVYFSARTRNDTNIWRIADQRPLLRRTWRASPLMSSTEEAVHPSVSGDGSVAFAGLEAKLNLWLAPLDGHGPPRRLTAGIEINSSPSISRDGQRILYFRRLGNERRVILRETDGENILNDPVPAGTRGLISPNGAFIMYTKLAQGSRDLYQRSEPDWSERLITHDSGELLDLMDDGGALIASTAGISILNLQSRVPRLLLRNGKLAFDQASISPDRHWIVYLGNHDPEHTQLFVAPLAGLFVDLRHSRAISDAAHWNDKPRWAPDGQSIFYVSDADGFTCIWKQSFNVSTGSAGPPQPFIHFHHVRLSPMHLSRVAFNMSVSRQEVLYNAGDLRSNIWIARPE